MENKTTDNRRKISDVKLAIKAHELISELIQVTGALDPELFDKAVELEAQIKRDLLERIK